MNYGKRLSLLLLIISIFFSPLFSAASSEKILIEDVQESSFDQRINLAEIASGKKKEEDLKARKSRARQERNEILQKLGHQELLTKGESHDHVQKRIQFSSVDRVEEILPYRQERDSYLCLFFTSLWSRFLVDTLTDEDKESFRDNNLCRRHQAHSKKSCERWCIALFKAECETTSENRPVSRSPQKKLG